MDEVRICTLKSHMGGVLAEYACDSRRKLHLREVNALLTLVTSPRTDSDVMLRDCTGRASLYLADSPVAWQREKAERQQGIKNKEG